VADFSSRVRRRVRRGLNDIQQRIVEFERDGGFERISQRVQRVVAQGQAQVRAGVTLLTNPEATEVRRWYARLELPYGAPMDEVKHSYRRLMRLYHPDRHTSDADTEAIATRISQDITVAYEGLSQWLQRGRLAS
jgi:DnaJ-domain-containing protein 1